MTGNGSYVPTRTASGSTFALGEINLVRRDAEKHTSSNFIVDLLRSQGYTTPRTQEIVMADPTLSERLVDFFAVHKTWLDETQQELLVGFLQLERRIKNMDANVQALTAAVTTLSTQVGAALAQVGKLSPADESALASAVSNLNALSAEVSAVLNPTGVTGTTGATGATGTAEPAPAA
jgi:hypothetical protein